MEPRPDLFTIGMVKGSANDFVKSFLVPSFQQYFVDRSETAGFEGSGTKFSNLSNKELDTTKLMPEEYQRINQTVYSTCSTSTQTDLVKDQEKFDPIAIFYDSIQSAPSAREISARVRAECTKEHRIALEQALQSLTSEHKLALNSITNVLNAERNARAAEREHFEADRRIMSAEQKRLQDIADSFTNRQAELSQKELALQVREADLTAITKQLVAKEDLIISMQAQNKELQNKIADLQASLSLIEDQKKTAHNEISTLERKIIGLEETLKLYESVARYYSSQIYAPTSSPPILPPCLPFPPTSDSRPTGHYRQLQNAPPNYFPFNNIYPVEMPSDNGILPSMNYESGISDDDHISNHHRQPNYKYYPFSHPVPKPPIQAYFREPAATLNQAYINQNVISDQGTLSRDHTYPPRQLQYPIEGGRTHTAPDPNRQSQFQTHFHNNTIYQGTPIPDLHLQTNNLESEPTHISDIDKQIYLSAPQSESIQLPDKQTLPSQAIGYSVFPTIDGFSPSRASTLQTNLKSGSAPPGGELPDRPSYKSAMSVKAFSDSKIGSASQSKVAGCALEEPFSESPDPVVPGINALSPVRSTNDHKTSLSKLSEKSPASDPAVDVGRYSESSHKSPIKAQPMASSSPIKKSVIIVEDPTIQATPKLKEASYQYSMTFDESLHSEVSTSTRPSEHQRSRLSLGIDTNAKDTPDGRANLSQPRAKQNTKVCTTKDGTQYVIHHSSSTSASTSTTEQKNPHETLIYTNDFNDFSDAGLRTNTSIMDVAQPGLQGLSIDMSPSANLYGDLGPVEIAFDDF